MSSLTAVPPRARLVSELLGCDSVTAAGRASILRPLPAAVLGGRRDHQEPRHSNLGLLDSGAQAARPRSTLASDSRAPATQLCLAPHHKFARTGQVDATCASGSSGHGLARGFTLRLRVADSPLLSPGRSAGKKELGHWRLLPQPRMQAWARWPLSSIALPAHACILFGREVPALGVDQRYGVRDPECTAGSLPDNPWGTLSTTVDIFFFFWSVVNSSSCLRA